MSKKKPQQVDALGFEKVSQTLSDNYKQYESILKNLSSKLEEGNFDPLNLQEPLGHIGKSISQNPNKVIEENMKFLTDSMKLYQEMSANFMGMTMPAESLNKGASGEDAVIKPEAGDRRFKHDAWEQHPVFKHIRDTYLLTSKRMRSIVSEADGLDENTAKKVEFFTDRYLDALSPTNFAATNPAVIERLVESKGASLVHGLNNMLEDIDEEGQLKIRMTDTDAFTLGENIATLPGKVIFENRMQQLIQYEPATPSVFKKPILIVPPWINKYYILDLQPKNSYLKWLVDQGHTVFIISWVNPDESYKETGFEDYVSEGVLAALDAITAATDEVQVNAVGYCLGGTLLAITLAYMAAKQDKRISGATFLATMMDFEDPGDLGVFLGEKEVSSLEDKMNEQGYLDGDEMAGTFNLLRANDLIWSYFINNYLMGDDVRPFDLLYWNSDSTRMPAKMHSWYLRNLYMKNLLVERGGLEINGVPIDLKSVTIPVCFVSALEDHIAPWKSTYSGVKLFGGSTMFVLGGSGHIAGIVNPPEAKKYSYRVTQRPPVDAEKWFEKADVNDGSWWPTWQEWIKGKSGKQVDARIPGSGRLDVMENAPGSYVAR